MKESSVSLATVVRYCDRLLRTREISDYSGASNGLQVENKGRVSRLGATVDASLATLRLAVEQEVDLLLVHHGLFWGDAHPWTGRRMELLRLLLDKDVAIYSSHLPLDCHRRLGNNAGLCQALGFKQCQPFFSWKEQKIGLKTRARIKRDTLAKKLARVTGGEPIVLPGGPSWCERIGVVTGGAGGDVAVAAAEGVDTFITGEGPHWTYALAEDLGVNVFYAGHYATETFGVKALARHLSQRFKLPWTFLDHPTGL